MKTNNSVGSDKKYLSILSDGKFHQTVDEGTEGAVVRTYKDKSEVEHTKTELVFTDVTGIITKVSFEDGEFGKSLQIEIDGDGIISVGTASNFGEDLMKKLPAIDLKQEVKIAPYSFKDDKGKTRRGVTVYQNDAKVENYYKDSTTKEIINGMPEPGDTSKFDSDDWKLYFMQVRKFLIQQVQDKLIGF